MGKKGDFIFGTSNLSVVWMVRWGNLSISETAELLGFFNKVIIYRKWSKKDKTSRKCSLGESTLLMPEVRKELTKSFELIGKQKQFNQPVVATKVCRRACVNSPHVTP